MNRFYLAALLAFALATSVFFHPIVGLVVFSAGVVAPMLPAYAWAGAVAFVALVAPAWAADDTTVSLGGLVTALLPYFEAAVAALLTALIAWAAQAIQKWLGIQLDQSSRDALHSAAMTGVNMALSRLSQSAANLTFDAKSAVIAQAIEWVESSVPDALKHFGLTPEQLEALIESKLGIAAAAAAPAVVAPAPAPAG
ncbi:hypothetical protein [Labrys sp. ZIDIC5]|uniref:hypothetical protein n=1 Tax=Labrys sedimenti TaxID=3106036 RepID=UPI002ACAF762|nr:hypothetical protein [Labrys sp. ZIDIC5]MDZ5448974.1 hypothetical protein [Labrys sp. ZIDIC5]